MLASSKVLPLASNAAQRVTAALPRSADYLLQRAVESGKGNVASTRGISYLNASKNSPLQSSRAPRVDHADAHSFSSSSGSGVLSFLAKASKAFIGGTVLYGAYLGDRSRQMGDLGYFPVLVRARLSGGAMLREEVQCFGKEESLATAFDPNQGKTVVVSPKAIYAHGHDGRERVYDAEGGDAQEAMGPDWAEFHLRSTDYAKMFKKPGVVVAPLYEGDYAVPSGRSKAITASAPDTALELAALFPGDFAFQIGDKLQILSAAPLNAEGRQGFVRARVNPSNLSAAELYSPSWAVSPSEMLICSVVLRCGGKGRAGMQDIQREKRGIMRHFQEGYWDLSVEEYKSLLPWTEGKDISGLPWTDKAVMFMDIKGVNLAPRLLGEPSQRSGKVLFVTGVDGHKVGLPADQISDLLWATQCRKEGEAEFHEMAWQDGGPQRIFIFGKDEHGRRTQLLAYFDVKQPKDISVVDLSELNSNPDTEELPAPWDKIVPEAGSVAPYVLRRPGERPRVPILVPVDTRLDQAYGRPIQLSETGEFTVSGHAFSGKDRIESVTVELINGDGKVLRSKTLDENKKGFERLYMIETGYEKPPVRFSYSGSIAGIDAAETGLSVRVRAKTDRGDVQKSAKSEQLYDHRGLLSTWAERELAFER